MAENQAGTYYPHLREVLDPRFAAFTDAEFESVFESAFGEGVTPAEYEEFFGGLDRALGRFAQQVGPALGTGVQGALQGATAGSALGPWGTLAGALAGGTGAALQAHGQGSARTVGNVLSGVVNTAGMFTGRGGLAGPAAGSAAGPAGGAGGAAPVTSQLLDLLCRPEMAQAFGALLSGRNTAVPVGNAATPVPAKDFAGLLGALAKEAEAEAAAAGYGEAVPGYLMNSEGQLVADPTDPDQRAVRLLQLLVQDAAERYHDYGPEFDEASFYDAEVDDVYFDGAFEPDYVDYDVAGSLAGRWSQR